MNIAALLALLLSSGACAPSDFHAGDGSTLRVVVCPLTLPPAAAPAPEDAPPPPPARPPVPERHI